MIIYVSENQVDDCPEANDSYNIYEIDDDDSELLKQELKNIPVYNNKSGNKDEIKNKYKNTMLSKRKFNNVISGFENIVNIEPEFKKSIHRKALLSNLNANTKILKKNNI